MGLLLPLLALLLLLLAGGAAAEDGADKVWAQAVGVPGGHVNVADAPFPQPRLPVHGGGEQHVPRDANYTRVHAEECATLLRVAQQATLTKRELLETWRAGVDCCEWRSVFCAQSGDLRGHVTSLTLSTFTLYGTLPPALSELPFLASLRVSGNHLTALPPRFGAEGFPNLLELDLGDLRTRALPATVFELTRLTHLTLSNMGLTALPDGIEKLRDLFLLDVSSNGLTSLSSELSTLSALEVLYVSNNRLASLDNVLAAVPRSLVNLQLSGNTDLVIRRAFPTIPTLKYIEWEGVQFEGGTMPASLYHAPLNDISFRDTNLATFPPLPDGMDRPNWTPLSLNFAATKLRTFPSWLSLLAPPHGQAAFGVYVDKVALERVPDALLDLPFTVFLSLTECGLTSLDGVERANLPALEQLYIRGNKLTTVPAALFESLPRLTSFDLWDNPIQSLPAANYSRVQSFGVSNSRVVFPDEMRYMPALQSLTMESVHFPWPLDTMAPNLRYVSFDFVSGVDMLPMSDHYEVISVYGTPMKRLPDLSRCASLASLEVRDAGLQVPPQLPPLLQGKRQFNLVLTGVEFTEWTLDSTIPRLTSLEISMRGVDAQGVLHTDLCDYPSLQKVELRRVRLHVENRLDCPFVNITTLSIEDVPVDNVHDLFRTISGVTELRLANTSIHTLPDVGHMDRLQSVSLQHNYLTELPLSLYLLPQLDHVDVRFNMLTHLHPIVCNAQWRVLLVSHNELESLFEHCDFLPRCAQCRTDLHALRLLDAGFNRITSLPGYILMANSLTTLIVSHNELAGAPLTFTIHSTVGHGDSLTAEHFVATSGVVTIDLSHNHIAGRLPPIISGALIGLDLSYNHIDSITFTQYDTSLRPLQVLDLGHNAIGTNALGDPVTTGVLASLAEAFPRLTRISLVDNPMAPLPIPEAWGSWSDMRDVRIDSLKAPKHSECEQSREGFALCLPSWMEVGELRDVGGEPYSCYVPRAHDPLMLVSTDWIAYFDGQNCRCHEGYYGHGQDCAECIPNGFCPGGESERAVYPQPGYWGPPVEVTTATNNASAFVCPHSGDVADYFSHCKAVFSTVCSVLDVASDGHVEWSECSEGYEDRMCTRCSSNFFRWGDRCARCPAGALRHLFVAVMVLQLVVYLLYLYRSGSSDDGVIKVFIFFFGMLRVLTSMGVPLPSELTTGTHSMSGTSLALPGLECANDRYDFADHVWVVMATPLLLVATTIGVIYQGGLLAVRVHSGVRPSARWWQRNVRVGGFLVFTSFQYVSKTTLSTLYLARDECRGVTYFEFAPYLAFDTPRAHALYGTAWLVSLVFVFGLPVFAAYWFWTHRHTLNEPAFLHKYGFVYTCYRRECWWWEGVVTIRRLVVVVMLSSLGLSNRLLPYMLVVALLIAAELQRRHAPFKEDALNTAEYYSLLLLVVNFAVVNVYVGDTRAYPALSWLLLALDIGALLYALARLRGHQISAWMLRAVGARPRAAAAATAAERERDSVYVEMQ